MTGTSRTRRIASHVFAVLNWLVPKARRKVVLHSIPDLEDGIQSVLSLMLARGFEPVVLFDAPNTRERFRRIVGDRPVRFVHKDSAAAALHFLTARYVFVTHGLYGHPAPPPWQCVVNLWHGEPPGKVVGRYEGEPTRHATMSPVLSGLGQAYRCTAFGMHPSRVPVLGAPRNDRMLRADPELARTRLVPEAMDRTVFLWLPTFRRTVPGRYQRADVRGGSSVLPFGADDVKRLDEWLDARGALVVVKAHPASGDELPGELKAIRALTQAELESFDLTVYTMLAAFDGLITDISSVWVDYLLLDRPIVFAFPDIEQYRATRGISLEPYESWVPGPLVRSVDALMDAVGAILDGRDEFRATRDLARRRTHRYCDDRSTARVVDHAMGRRAGPTEGARGT
ncbi:MAG TPA: CDP-glycerol glycerophosphotransferase family protein [Streptosporangiales bacterium]